MDESPGVSRATAQGIIAEIGLDMTRFSTPGHLVSWAKLSPHRPVQGQEPRRQDRQGHPLPQGHPRRGGRRGRPDRREPKLALSRQTPDESHPAAAANGTL